MSFDFGDPSCSDCKLELIEKRWTQLLLNWINKCVYEKVKVNQLDLRSLIHMMKKYKSDVCLDKFDKAMLVNDDIEPFIKYKYPILRLRYLSDERSFNKKMYIMTSVLLFHCCTNSQTGLVDHDICSKLGKEEQELILKFCENLNEMERTINNVDCAIRGAFEHVIRKHTSQGSSIQSVKEGKITNDDFATSDSANINESDATDTGTKSPTLKFKSSVTLLPSVVTDTSSYSNSASSEFPFKGVELIDLNDDANLTIYNVKSLSAKEEEQNMQPDSSDLKRCQPGCACVRCSASGLCCGEPGKSMDLCLQENEACKENDRRQSWRPWVDVEQQGHQAAIKASEETNPKKSDQ